MPKHVSLLGMFEMHIIVDFLLWSIKFNHCILIRPPNIDVCEDILEDIDAEVDIIQPDNESDVILFISTRIFDKYQACVMKFIHLIYPFR